MADQEYWEKRAHYYKTTIGKIVDEDSQGSGWMFKKLKRLTKYDQFEKREGSVVDRAVDEHGNIISGDELNKRLLEHYA